MSKIMDIVQVLEQDVQHLLDQLNKTNSQNKALQQKVAMLTKTNQSNEVALQNWEEKYNTLKLATTMLGSNNDKTEAKLKINALIRDLDYCIAQLAE